MLGKLIKYDLKSLNRFLILIHALLLLSAFLIRFFLTGRIISGAPQANLFLALSMTLGFMIIMAVTFATAIIICVRFYKNLFSDEGYLTHTLPVTRGQHLLSKTIAGSIWSCIDTLLLLASLYIVAATPYTLHVLRQNGDTIIQEFGCADINMSPGTFIFIFIAFCCFGAISNVITYYACITIGQLIPGHKILGSIAVYFALTTVISMISLMVLAIFGLFGSTASIINADSFVPAKYFLDTLKLSAILALVIDVVLYIITYYIMKKKVNMA